MVTILSQQARSAALIALLMAVGTLSGCLGDADTPTDGLDTGDGAGLSAWGCAPSEDLLVTHLNPQGEVTIGGELVPLFPIDFEGPAPVKICIINDGTAADGIMAMPQPLDDMPQWVIDALPPPADSDGHAHAHGAAVDPVFQFEVPAGKGQVFEVTETGGFMVHPISDQNKAGSWTVLPNATNEYEVGVHKLKLYTADNGTSAKGESADVTFDVPNPNLVRITGQVSWDDSVDDQDAGGSSTNKPDTLQVELVDPAGNVVEGSTKKKTARNDYIVIDSSFSTTDWPATVSGIGEADAAANITSVRPDDTSLSGLWTVRVTVIAAAGAVDDKDGTLNPASPDEGQSFAVDIQFMHAYGTIVGPGETATDKLLEAPL